MVKEIAVRNLMKQRRIHYKNERGGIKVTWIRESERSGGRMKLVICAGIVLARRSRWS